MMLEKEVKYCDFKGCEGVATGNLILIDKETNKEMDVCATHYFNLAVKRLEAGK